MQSLLGGLEILRLWFNDGTAGLPSFPLMLICIPVALLIRAVRFGDVGLVTITFYFNAWRKSEVAL